MISSSRRRAGTLAALAALVAFVGGCGDEGSTAADARDTSPANATEQPTPAATPMAPAEHGRSIVEMEHGNVLAMWQARFRAAWSGEPRIRWTADEQSIARWTVTAAISDGNRVRERATWTVNMPLDPSVTPDDLTAEQLADDEVFARPVNATARRLSQLPPAAPGSAVQVLAYLMQADDSGQPLVSPSFKSDAEGLAVRDGKLNEALLRGIHALGDDEKASGRLPWASTTRLREQTSSGTQTIDRPGVERALRDAVPLLPVLLTWTARPGSHPTIAQLLKTQPDELLVLTR